MLLAAGDGGNGDLLVGVLGQGWDKVGRGVEWQQPHKYILTWSTPDLTLLPCPILTSAKLPMEGCCRLHPPASQATAGWAEPP